MTDDHTAQRLDELVAEVWDSALLNFPEFATMLGDHRNDDKLTDVSEAARSARLEQSRGFLARLSELPLDALEEEPRITAEVLKMDLEQDLEGERFEFHKWGVDQLSGFQVSYPTMLQTFHPKRSEADVENLVARMRAAGERLDQVCAHLRAGAAEGYKTPRIALERVIGQVEDILAASPEEGVFGRVADSIPESISNRDALRGDALAAAREVILPAFERYRDTLRDACLPKASDNNGLWDNKSGDACYAFQVKRHLGVAMEPKDIHEIGREQLARIHSEMDAIARDQGMSREEYGASLRQDATNFHATKEALVEEYQALIEKAEARLPELFTRLPASKCVARAIEEYREKDAPTGFYNPPAPDGSRPGLFYANTYQPETRMRSNMACLTYHEAVPGHHLQIALAMELDLPEIRRHGRNTAYVEGWALYTERLCDEIGLYDSPRDRFGMLGYQAWRAARLVVDTGLHAMRWSREQAIEELDKATSLPRSEVVNEIDRYLIMPGQALSYKIGELEIQKLRAQARDRLGEAFDLRRFHDRLLASGALPLGILAGVMDRWVAAQAAA